MTDAPERIWTTGNTRTGSWNNESMARFGLPEVEYIRADLAKPTVKPEDVLDAASRYLTLTYGIAALSHPVDRSRILSALEDTWTP